MIIFKKIRDKENRFDTTDLIMRSNSSTITEILEDFADFLRGCGYSINGQLEVVNYEEDGKDVD